MKLHNLCLDHNIETPLSRFNEDVRQGDELVLVNNFVKGDRHLLARATGNRRANITQALEDEQRGRPVHAQVNSRA